MVNLLGLNMINPQTVRQRCLRVLLLYQKQPNDPEVRALYLDYFGYPDNLPDLDVLLPESNTRLAGLTEAYFRQRHEGRLAAMYF